jgi:hypothetical protein
VQGLERQCEGLEKDLQREIKELQGVGERVGCERDCRVINTSGSVLSSSVNTRRREREREEWVGEWAMFQS